MKRIYSLLLAVPAIVIVVAACGGQTAERAKDDIKGAGNDLSNGVGTKGDGGGLSDGISPNRNDGGATGSGK